MNDIDLSVIIVSYNKVDILDDCLRSIEKFNDLGNRIEIIVSDNSPNMDIFNHVKSFYQNVTIIKNNNCGYGAGNNRGAEICHGRYLLFLNPDTIMVEPLFKFVIEQFDMDDNLAICGVQLIDSNGEKTTSFCSYDIYSIYARLKDRFYQKKSKFKDKKMFIAGADIFIRKDSFIEAGMFDEKIFMYKEEADLTKRVKLFSRAKEIKFFPHKKIVHLEGGTESGDLNFRLNVAKRLNESDKYYAEKWHIDYRKILKSRIRFSRFKYLVFSCLFRKKLAIQERELLDFYKSNLD